MSQDKEILTRGHQFIIFPTPSTLCLGEGIMVDHGKMEALRQACEILQSLLRKILEGGSLNLWEESARRMYLVVYFELGGEIGASEKTQIRKLLRFCQLQSTLA
ncbi:MAG: hypothetical protein O3C23_00465 [bacterium]|nr:hypothetical protein [bacterium]